MTTNKPISGTFSPSLSQRHGGQICIPVLAVTVKGRGKAETHYTAEWHWIDQSIPLDKPGREYGHGKAAGEFREVLAAVNAAGIQTDDHRF